MKILATFDGSGASEATFPVLKKMAALPNAEIVLFATASKPHSSVADPGRKPMVASTSSSVLINAQEPRFAEVKSQAIERRIDETHEYLLGLARLLPDAASVRAEAGISEHPADAIIERARMERADVIVMAARGAGGISRAIFGSTTEKVMRSGVAPVLVVHP